MLSVSLAKFTSKKLNCISNTEKNPSRGRDLNSSWVTQQAPEKYVIALDLLSTEKESQETIPD